MLSFIHLPTHIHALPTTTTTLLAHIVHTHTVNVIIFEIWKSTRTDSATTVYTSNLAHTHCCHRYRYHLHFHPSYLRPRPHNRSPRSTRWSTSIPSLHYLSPPSSRLWLVFRLCTFVCTFASRCLLLFHTRLYDLTTLLLCFSSLNTPGAANLLLQGWNMPNQYFHYCLDPPTACKFCFIYNAKWLRIGDLCLCLQAVQRRDKPYNLLFCVA